MHNRANINLLIIAGEGAVMYVKQTRQDNNYGCFAFSAYNHS